MLMAAIVMGAGETDLRSRIDGTLYTDPKTLMAHGFSDTVWVTGASGISVDATTSLSGGADSYQLQASKDGASWINLKPGGQDSLTATGIGTIGMTYTNAGAYRYYRVWFYEGVEGTSVTFQWRVWGRTYEN